MKKLILIICLLALLISGCNESSAGFRVIGPYITDISYDDEGNLLVKKEKIVLFAPDYVFKKTTESHKIEPKNKESQ